MLPGLVLLLSLQIPPAPKAISIQPRAEASVFQVRGILSGAKSSQGSGVLIAPGLVATNAHVIEGTRDVSIHQGNKRWSALPLWVDRNRDLCLLEVAGLNGPVVQLAPESTGPGQKVAAVGYPGGRGPVISSGRLRGVWHLGDGRMLQSDAPISPGSSGGGLFDDQGRLLGITTMTISSLTRMNFSISATWVRAAALNPEQREASPLDWSLGSSHGDLLEKLASDPRNRAAWGLAARQWVLDFPKDENAWMALGLVLDRSVRGAAAPGLDGLTEAVEAYRRSLALRGDAKVWNNLGADLDLLNRFDEAERAYGEALAMEPGYALAWLNLGSTRMNARHFAKAVEAFETGLALRPDEADAWVRLALCQRMLRQHEAALASLRIALRYRPLAADLWLDWGLLLVDLARVDEAREIHNRLVSMNPELAARLKASMNRLDSIQASMTRKAK